MGDKKTKNVDVIKKTIQSVLGSPAKLIAVPIELIHFIGNTQMAVFLCQLIYWSDKGKRDDGYIFKTKNEWKEETGLSENQITRFTKIFVALGFLDIKLKKANGSPTIHYKLDIEKLSDLIRHFLEIRNSKNDGKETMKSDESLTENTSNNTHDITLEREALSPNNETLGLDSSLEQDWDINKELSANDDNYDEYDVSDTKILIPLNFEPTLDAKLKATIVFPEKWQSFATEKFIKNFRLKKLKKTISDWHDEWWNWMNREDDSPGNSQIEKERFQIEDEAENVIWDIHNNLDKYIFDANDIKEKAREQGLSNESVETVLELLVNSENFAKSENYYFNLRTYNTHDQYRKGINKNLERMGLPIPTDMGLKS